MRFFPAILLVILVILVLLSGCVSETMQSAPKSEQLSSQQPFDLNDDGIPDYGIYSFSPVKSQDIKSTIKRTIIATTETTATADSFKSLNELEFIEVGNLAESFFRKANEIEQTCSSNLGLARVTCLDPKTCLSVCSAASLKCKNIGQDYESALGNFIFSYHEDTSEMANLENQVKNKLIEYQELDDEEKADLLNKLNRVVGIASRIKSNPIFTQNEIKMCDDASYDIGKITKIEQRVAVYSTEPKSYKYTVILSVDASELRKEERFKYSQVSFTEEIPSSLNLKESDISLPKEATSSANSIQWQPLKSGKSRDILIYSFSSSIPPEQVVKKFNSPSGQVTSPNTAFLAPTLFIYDLFFSLTKNFYLSFGFALSLSVIILLLLLFILSLIYSMFRANMLKEDYGTAIKRAFGRTHVTWRSDAIAGALSLVIGVAVMALAAPKIDSQIDLFSVPELLFSNYLIVLSLAGLFFGPLLLYTALENRIKIMLLEKYYGKSIGEERGLFIARVAQLKERLKELKVSLDQSTKENFDVGAEYDVLDSISLERIDSLAKKADSYSKKVIEDELAKVEETLEKLHERKRIADESWQQWDVAITKLLEESEEIHTSSLITVPASLRSWALNKYLKSHADEGLALEGETLKRKIVTPEKIANSIVSKGLLAGCVILKDGKVAQASSPEGSGTMVGALTSKLLVYLKFLPKSIGQHDFNSLAVVGEKYVLVFLKHKTMHSLLMIPKDKFKEGMDEWKARMAKF